MQIGWQTSSGRTGGLRVEELKGFKTIPTRYPGTKQRPIQLLIAVSSLVSREEAGLTRYVVCIR